MAKNISKKIIVVEVDFDYGDEVYLKTDADQCKRQVISYKVFKNGEVLYELNCGTLSSLHYSFEISKQKDYTNAV